MNAPDRNAHVHGEPIHWNATEPTPEQVEARMGSPRWWQEMLDGHNAMADSQVAEMLSWIGSMYMQAKDMDAEKANLMHQGMVARVLTFMKAYGEPAARGDKQSWRVM